MKSDRESSTSTILLVILTVSTYVLFLFSLAKSLHTIDVPSSDLFEPFKVLGLPYVLGFSTWMLALVCFILYTRRNHGMYRLSSLPFLILALILYIVLPKYVYTIPLQREIYHTANIVYVYNQGGIGTSETYPSMPESVGYAIFYSTLSKVTGLELFSMLKSVPDLFQLAVVEVLALAFIRRYSLNPSNLLALFFLLGPIIFKLQIDTTYRNGFAVLIFVLILYLLDLSLKTKSSSTNVLLALALFGGSISYPGIPPLTLLMLSSAMFLIAVFRRFQAINEIYYKALLVFVAWTPWQLLRYPTFFKAVTMYWNSILSLFESPAEIKGIVERTQIYNPAYNLLLTFRTFYAITSLIIVGALALIYVYKITKEKKVVNLSGLVWLAVALVFLFMIFVGGKGNFHFMAIYNLFSYSLPFMSIALYTQIAGSKQTQSPAQIETRKTLLITIAILILAFFAPYVLWPAFINLMPLSYKEVELIQSVGSNIPATKSVHIGVIDTYADTMSFAIQYVFSNRTDIWFKGIPLLSNNYDDEIIMILRGPLSIESKVKFETPIMVWLKEYLYKAYSMGYSKIYDNGFPFTVLIKTGEYA
jgi:hypothetical protein